MRALCAEMRDCVGRDAPITIDQEGGRVQRLRGPVWTEWLPPLDFVAKAGPRAKEAMYLRFRLIAAELHDLGIDSNCAPMVDVASADTHDFLRNRCYGTDPANSRGDAGPRGVGGDAGRRGHPGPQTHPRPWARDLGQPLRPAKCHSIGG